MRNLISKIIQESPRLTLAGTAVNGRDAIEKIAALKPHAITLDLEMPELNGIGFLKQYNKHAFDMPVIVLSSLAHKGAAITMEALTLGAADFLPKPSGSISLDIHKVAAKLTELLIAYGSDYLRRKQFSNLQADLNLEPDSKPKDLTPEPTASYGGPKRSSVAKVLCIGISTGGPAALRELFLGLPKNFSLPILMVQHMPEGFTGEFARNLNQLSHLKVKEAEAGDLIEPGVALLAPGNAHIVVEKNSGGANSLALSHRPAVNGHRPSVDILFESVAKVYGGEAIALIMTGMGNDGVKGIGQLYNLGALTLAQDKKSSIVFGMPRLAIEAGYIHEVVPLNRLAEKLNKWARRLTPLEVLNG